MFVPAIDASKPVDVVKNEDLQSSMMALGALAAFGAASYGLLRGQWEYNVMVRDRQDRERRWIELKERQRVELERKQRQKLKNERLFQVAMTGLMLAFAVFALLHIGWLYFLLALMIAFKLFVGSLL
ncbi:hypothetical protein P3T76_008022 [Phytophthora citrophthora]|uniref:Transmembrane protein n=1 Tax=Phytophthora citrophthora TaxID=4793 RepID=A0AAD9GLF4_9STRA|nr:hypothetical protein P3T76_008022 [Phytophthora citrophthora]